MRDRLFEACLASIKCDVDFVELPIELLVATQSHTVKGRQEARNVAGHLGHLPFFDLDMLHGAFEHIPRIPGRSLDRTVAVALVFAD